jgi:glycosyltransferase involved in cell wall biosynthesis
VPAVLVAGVASDRLQGWQDAAAEVGGWLDGVGLEDPAQLRDAVDARLEAEGQLVVRTTVSGLPWLLPCLEPMAASGRLLAVALSDGAAAASWSEVAAQLAQLGLAPCVVRERQGEAVVVRLHTAPATELVIAIAEGLVDPPAPVSAPPVLPPTPMVTPPVTPPVDPAIGAGIGTARGRWMATRDGFLLMAPHSRTGYGVAGSHLLRALQRQGVPVAFFPLGPVDPTLTPNPALQGAMDAQGIYRGDVPSVRMSQAFDLALHVGRGPRIGFPIFELDTFTRRELHHLRQLDAIVVCTEWARQVCLQNGLTDRPIHVVPLGVDAEVFHPGVAPERRRTDTVFLQVGKLEARKGQRELLRAFEDAFAPGDPVRLVLACGNPFATREQMEAMLRPFRASRMASRITLVTTELPALRDVATLMAGADCGVFPVRAEGWNLEALEMLAMGKAVVATHCTAHTEFLTPANARLVGAPDLEMAHDGAAVGRWAAWGPSQHAQLVAHLRAVHEARQGGTLGVNVAGVETAARFSWEHAASRLVEALVAVTGAPRAS